MSQIKILLIFSSLMLIISCQHEKPDLNAYVKEVKSKQKVDIPPLPVMKAYETFDYSASELRDPFTRTVVEVPEKEEVPIIDNGIRPDRHRVQEALEAYELAELQLVGTLEQEGVWALVRSPDGVIHRVTNGNYMGSNHGKILTISETELVLNEIVSEGEGRYIERESLVSVIDVN